MAFFGFCVLLFICGGITAIGGITLYTHTTIADRVFGTITTALGFIGLIALYNS